VSGPEVITFGCRLNYAESEAMRQLSAGEDDLIIVNSCAVTNEAVRQTRQAIRRAKRARPDARVVVTGCAAQVEPEGFAAMPEVSRVLGNREKFDFSSFRTTDAAQPEPRHFDKIRVSDIMTVRETAPHLLTGFAERARAFVEVQNGCDHRCTFCIIPFGRGNSRSVPAGLVVERVKELVGQGYQEVVLTGVDVTSYGPDLPGQPSLGLLVDRILRHVPDLPRLRLSSIDCIEIDDRLFDLITGDKRMMPHLHLSLQAGDDMVLKRMKRRHSRGQAVALVERLKARRPDIAIGADLIAGFPTESEDMATNSLALIDDCDIVMGHIFPYSPKQGTPAARMPQVVPATIKQRARRLREATARRRNSWLQSMVGTSQRVLVELDGVSGHTESFAPIRVARNPEPRLRYGDGGEIIEVEVIGTDMDRLVGVAA
jgi:threonylcarbamoyladenosine tRNA methylthiotransferase MtaB